MIADSVDDKQRGLAFGLHRAPDTLGAFLGLGIAAFIIWRTQAQSSLLSLDTFRLVVLVSIVPAVLGVVVIALGAADVTGSTKTVELKRLSLKASSTSCLCSFCSPLATPPTRSSCCGPRSAD